MGGELITNGDVDLMSNNDHEGINQDITSKTDTFKLANDIDMQRWELKKLIKKIGIENIRFVMYLNTLDHPIPIVPAPNTLGYRDFTECRIDESIYKVADWYKITLVPVERTGKYGYTHLYVTTLVSLINSGEIKLKSAT